MKRINILHRIANLLVQVLMLVIYVPKTLCIIPKDPEWVCQFIPEKSSKQEASKETITVLLLCILFILTFTDQIRLKIVEKLGGASEWLVSGIPILIFASITTLYCIALIKNMSF